MSRVLHVLCRLVGVAASLLGIAMIVAGKGDIGFAVALVLAGPAIFFLVRVYDNLDKFLESDAKENVGRLMRQVENQDQDGEESEGDPPAPGTPRDPTSPR